MYGKSLRWKISNEDRIRGEKLYNYRKQLCRTAKSDENTIRFLEKKIKRIEKHLQ